MGHVPPAPVSYAYNAYIGHLAPSFYFKRWMLTYSRCGHPAIVGGLIGLNRSTGPGGLKEMS